MFLQAKSGKKDILVVLALADVYEALISERVYKKAFPKEKAIEIIRDGRGTQFDPILTDLFLSVLDERIAKKNELKKTRKEMKKCACQTGIKLSIPFASGKTGATAS